MRWILVLGGFAVSSLPFAAEVLSWQRCVELATQNSPELRASEQSLQSIRYLEGVAENDFMPQVSGGLAAIRSNSNVNSSILTVGGGHAPSTNYSASVTATQNIFSGLLDYGKVKQAKANTRAAEATLQTEKATVSLELKTNYEGYLYAKAFLDLTHSIEKRRTQNLRIVDLHYQSGLDDKGNVMLSQANVNQAQYEVVQAIHGLENSRAALDKTLGLDKGSSYDITDPVPIVEPPSESPPYLQMISDNPAHLLAVSTEEGAHAVITQARSQFYPTVNLTATEGRTDPSLLFTNDNAWSVTLGLTVPLFNGFRDYYTTKSDIAAWAAALTAENTTDLTLISALKTGFNGYVEATMYLKVTKSFRDAAEQRAEIARAKYNTGLMTFDDWDVIEADLITRQKNYTQSIHDRVVAEATWESAQGKGVIP